jgi:hypothetical protein
MHINGCDGYPIVNGKSAKSQLANNKVKIGKEEFQFPEKLVSRSSQFRKNEDTNYDMHRATNSVEIVKKRREYIGKEEGKAKYTSSLIRSFAASRKAVLLLCYKYAENNGLKPDERDSLIKNILTQMPIDLDGYQTNYQVAFKGTKFFSPYSKIWNGYGDVLINKGNLYIKSCQKCEYKVENDIKELDFYVAIKIPGNLEACPKYHKTIINRLKNAQERNEQVRWFAYSAPEFLTDKEVILLNINALDHVFIQEPNRKNGLYKNW